MQMPSVLPDRLCTQTMPDMPTLGVQQMKDKTRGEAQYGELVVLRSFYPLMPFILSAVVISIRRTNPGTFFSGPTQTRRFELYFGRLESKNIFV